MNRRQFFFSSVPMALKAANRQPPNVIMIMPDQWRGMDFGCAGNRQVRTPNLDRMAREGVHFTGAVANTPVCTPARGTLLTGRYPHVNGTPVNDVPLPDSELTIAEILARRGYYTGFVGKWHLEGGLRLPGFVPSGQRRQGFEFWAANICSHDYFKQTYFRDDPEPIQMPRYDAITWTDLALEFLGRAKTKQSPSFLCVWYPTPHDPYIPPPGFETMYKPEDIQLRENWKAGAKINGEKKHIAGYYAAMACLDEQIGRILLRADENTIVLVTSDHGDMLGSHGTFLKRKPWEESVRVPGLIRWPAGLKSGFTTDAPFSHVDIAPTILGLCGEATPASMQGFDYSNFLRKRSGRTPDHSKLMIYTAAEAQEFGPWRGLRTRRYKYARFQDKPWVLYDLAKDPYELENMAASPASAKLIAQFDKIIENHMRRTGDRWEELKDRPFR